MQTFMDDAPQPNSRVDRSMRVHRGSLTLRERTADVIRQAIVDQKLPPGTHLKERQLCEMLGVSRTSVREALRHLESEHLIETIPHRGPVVVALSTTEAGHLYMTRAVLEGLVGELFARNATDQDVSRLSSIASTMAQAAMTSQNAATLRAIEDFYEVLLDGSGNRICAQLIRSLKARISVFRRLALANEERRLQMMSDIEKIVSAAVARDPEALRNACIQHVEAAGAAVMRQLSSNEE